MENLKIAMKEILKSCVDKVDDWIELRYHHRRRNSIMARGGRIDTAESIVKAGVGVRTMVDGCYGFSSTDELTETGIMQAVHSAIVNARNLSKLKKRKVTEFKKIPLATEDYFAPGYESLMDMTLQDKLDAVVKMERAGKASSKYITRATCRYSELLEDKIIVTSDGACARQRLAQPEFLLGLIAEKSGVQTTYRNGAGISGDWESLFQHPSIDNVVEKTSGLAVDLLSAGYVEGGK
ncbi:MAG TPA: hypothetical protein ENL08_01025, partial [Bacteroidetes bacterium]|nr:hypothetical protein [Bacteroidota bacterium]